MTARAQGKMNVSPKSPTGWSRGNIKRKSEFNTMEHRFKRQIMATVLAPVLWLLAGPLQNCAKAETQPVTVIVPGEDSSPELAPRFLGLSYESSMLLPGNGGYYFDAHNQALVNVFKTLGIKSLRIGGNSVDDASCPVPQERDIDQLFQFARAAGVKVIYSFRLKNGQPAESARLARYIADHYPDWLDTFAIGNEPELYKPKPTYTEFFALWKPHYDAILKSVPQAWFDGPSGYGNKPGGFALDFAGNVFPDGHLAMVSDHHYFLGPGRVAETNPPATRARFLSNRVHENYEKSYARLVAPLALQKIPYRMDEMNSCSSGGAKDASDTYASTLWALDCTHWWAAHHILGLNYHTGELVGRDGTFAAPNYAAFLRQKNGAGFAMRPQAYALLAFTQGAQGSPLDVIVHVPSGFHFNAYALRNRQGFIYVTLINKSYGDHAQPASVSLQLPAGVTVNTPEELDLTQANQDVAAQDKITLGGAEVDPQGIWAGQWTKIIKDSPSIEVTPASAKILRFRVTSPSASSFPAAVKE